MNEERQVRDWTRMARYLGGLSWEVYRAMSWRRRHLTNQSLDDILDAENESAAPKRKK